MPYRFKIYPNIGSEMPPRSYHHLCPPDIATNGIDQFVRYYEFIRINMRDIQPDIPPHYELDLMASGSPHCEGLVPMLGIFIPEGEANHYDIFELDDVIESWLDRFDADELFLEIDRKAAPTYEQLCTTGTHPQRLPKGNAG